MTPPLPHDSKLTLSIGVTQGDHASYSVIPTMDESIFEEHALDSLLDMESEGDFGKPEIRDRFDPGADPNTSGNLKNWSAQDFASIHVRFRPHLERHARRYLSNPVQAEEVVQDAFLYLLTTLPELDSELGVLKFLKWKIRLLSFDVLRAASNNRETPVPEHIEFAGDDQEFTAEFERAEDNAVIRLALAKLNPRQREALIANVYEDKTSEQIAEQLRLSPNATRQLLFRARSAFRKALVGEAETNGKSLSQVLAIATKKAALDAKDNAMKIGAFIVLVSVGVGIFPTLVPSNETVVAERPVIGSPAPTDQTVPSRSEQEGTSSDSGLLSVPEADLSPRESRLLQRPEEVEADSIPPVSEPQIVQAVSTTPAEQGPSTQSLIEIMETNIDKAGIYTNRSEAPFGIAYQDVVVEVFGGTGISAFLDLNIESRSVSQTIFLMSIDAQRYFGIARVSNSETLDNGDGYTVAIISEEFYVVDEQGSVFSESPLADSKSVVTLELDENGAPQSASLKVESKR